MPLRQTGPSLRICHCDSGLEPEEAVSKTRETEIASSLPNDRIASIPRPA